MQIRARAELTSIDGKKITFQIESRDKVEMIGEALHECFVIDTEKFIPRAQVKRQSRPNCDEGIVDGGFGGKEKIISGDSHLYEAPPKRS